MPKSFSLLFLLLLCTCGHAQINEVLPSRSGSMWVDITDNTRVISVSSADYYKIYYYVSEELYRQRPERFKNYEVVSFAGPGDLRMMHAVIDDLIQRGWQMVESNYELDVENNVIDGTRIGTLSEEKLYFNFLVPPGAEPDELPASIVLMAAEVVEKDKQVIRGDLLVNADSTYTLLVEELVGNRWLEKYRLTDTGFTDKGKALLIDNILLAKDYFELEVKMPDGSYRYRFSKGVSNRYYFSALLFQSVEECGVVEYSVFWKQSGQAQLKGLRRVAPCDPTRNPKMFFTDVRLNKAQLRNFTPGAQRIELEKIGSSVYF